MWSVATPLRCFTPTSPSSTTRRCPQDAANGDGWIDGQWVKAERLAPPVDPEPLAPTPPKVSPVEFKLLFTPAERVAIKAARSADPVIDDFYDIIEDPRLTHVDLGLASTQAALGYLASQGLIEETRVAVILSGTLQ